MIERRQNRRHYSRVGTRSTLLLLLTAALSVTAVGAESVAFEAEAANQITKPFRVEFDHLASGQHCVVQPLKSGRPPAVQCQATYRLNVPAAGRYHLWGRAWWPNGCANSVNVKMDSGHPLTLGQDGTYQRWHWVELKGAAFNLTRGLHTLTMMNREDGPELDEFYLTTDEDYVPVGAVRVTAGLIAK
jgi:hypothetical protein